LIFTFAAALIFVFTSIVFVTYDLLVARRQRIVLNRAMASGAIVSSLFPQKVREQLYQDAKKETQEKSGMNTFFTRNEGAIEEKVTPNASLYEETTIFFADLVGFTAWSSKRTPIEVFELLETLYSAFDAIAAKRGVFKVETIGDCYVAATGIPEPQADHAVILVKFGQDCMTQFSQLTHDLVASLGADTAELDMRVGLHSGATTAGVLRGAKGRFQLFGDTVNTAARMESNGVRGRIHVSQATADALIIKGKSHWLINREDKVVAKGKGEMQTYFIAAVKSDKSVFTTGSSDDGESVFTTGLSDEEEINSSSGRTLY
jgi:class 3 adenylate cyclase